MSRGRVLVTGAGGVVAAGVVRRLAAEGYDVVAVDAREDGLARLRDTGVELVKLELPTSDVDKLLARARPEVVVHAAALVDTNLLQREPALGFRVNAQAGVDLLDAAARNNVARFVLLSSRAVYGLAEGGLPSDPPVREDEPLRPEGVYDVCKVAVEGMGKNYAATTGMAFVALRFATIFGPGKTARHSNASLFSRIIEDSLAGIPVTLNGSPTEAYDLVYVEDVRTAVFNAVTARGELSSAYNIGSGRITTLGSFVTEVEAQIPGAEIRISGTGQALPLRYRYPLDISRARKELSYEPTTSIREAVSHYLTELAADSRS